MTKSKGNVDRSKEIVFFLRLSILSVIPHPFGDGFCIGTPKVLSYISKSIY